MPFSKEKRRAENLVWETQGAWGIIGFDFGDLFVEENLLLVMVHACILVRAVKVGRSLFSGS